MAEMKMVPIHPDFKMDDMTDKLIKLYQAKGFGVMSSKIGDTVSITFSKDNDGIKKFVGLAKEITANFTISNNGGDAVLMINFTDAEWTGKIIGMVVGWFLCFIPFLLPYMAQYSNLDCRNLLQMMLECWLPVEMCLSSHNTSYV